MREALADEVRLDWTSLNGGEPVTLSGDTVAAAWRDLLGAFAATHHQLGNFLVHEVASDRAELTCYGTATHLLAAPGQEGRWVLGARYRATLRHTDRWRAEAITMTAVWGDGNQNLLNVAAAKAAADAEVG